LSAKFVVVLSGGRQLDGSFTDLRKKVDPYIKELKRKTPSYPQKCFYGFLKKIYPEKRFILEYVLPIPEKYLPLQFGANTEFFMLDIAERNEKIDIEIDGKGWHGDKQRDEERDRILREEGWKVIRVPAKDTRKIILERKFELD
jgi:hypothetical protein